MRKSRLLISILLAVILLGHIAYFQGREASYDTYGTTYITNNGVNVHNSIVTVQDDNDPYLVYAPNETLGDICRVEFSEPFECDMAIQLFYAKPQQGFCEEQVYTAWMSAGASDISFLLPEDEIAFLRIDLPLTKGQEIGLPVVSVLRQNSNYRFRVSHLWNRENRAENVKSLIIMVSYILLIVLLEKSRTREIKININRTKRYLLLVSGVIFGVWLLIAVFPLNYKLNIPYSGSAVIENKTANSKDYFFNIYSKGQYLRIPLGDRIYEVDFSTEEEITQEKAVVYYNNIIVGDGDIKYQGGNSYHISLQYQDDRIRYIIVGTVFVDIFCVILLVWFCRRKMLNQPDKIRTIDVDLISDAFIQVGILFIFFYLIKYHAGEWIYENFFTQKELSFLMIAVTVVMLLLRIVEKNWRVIIALSGPIMVVLSMSIYRLTSFISIDEPINYVDDMFIMDSDMLKWEEGTSRANYLIMGTIWSFVKNDQLHTPEMAKLFHWLCGGLIISFLCFFIAKKVCVNSRISKGYVFALCFTVITLSPVTLMALKNYNYDMFSLLFGVAAVVTGLYALDTSSTKTIWWALFWAILATAEKVIAYPVMMFLVMELIWLYCNQKPKSIGSVCIIAIKAHLFILGISYAMNLYLQYFLRKDLHPHLTVNNITCTLFSYARYFLSILINNCSYLGAVIFSIIITIFGFYVFYGLYYLVVKKPVIIRIVRILALCVLGAAVGMTIYRVYCVTYIKTDGNHFGFGQDYIVTFFSALATVALLLALCTQCLSTIGRLNYPLYYDFVLMFLGIMAPVSFGVLQLDRLDKTLRGGYRYQNIWIAAFSVVIMILAFNYLFKSAIFRSWITVTLAWLMLISVIVEAMPFQPSYTIFIPFWARGVDYDRTVSIENTPIGMPTGWGEDTMIAGQAIEQYLVENDMVFDEVNLLMNYPGQWTTKPSNFYVYQMPGTINHETSLIQYGKNEIPVNENDFYVFCLQGIKIGNMEFSLPPKEYIPIITIRQANITKIWIYSGAQIKDFLFAERDNIDTNEFILKAN